MKPLPIEQKIEEIKSAIPEMTEEQEKHIRKVIEDDRYHINLVGAINRTKTKESKAA